MKNIIISQWDKSYEKLKENFFVWWHSNLHVLADFDRTLTKNFVGGKEKPSLVSVLRSEGILWKKYSEAAYKLFDTYHSIEISTTHSTEEKRHAMNTWWQTHMQLIVDSGLQRKHVEEAISAGIIEFREWIQEFLWFLKQYGIPLVIISANAIGTDSIRDFLEIHNLDFDNIHIVSNQFIWDEKGFAIGYNKKVIHTFNKDETVLEQFPSIYDQIQDRKNILLLGDSLWDPGMSDGFEAEHIVKIWFLNKDPDILVERYKSVYDVLVLNDGSMEFANKFLKWIL